LQNDRVLSLLMRSIQDVAGGEQAGEVFDESTGTSRPEVIQATPAFINLRLGLELSTDEIKRLLENVEIEVEGELSIRPPFWRTDLELAEDVVEEVGRLYGFDKLPRQLPERSMKPAEKNRLINLKQTIRQRLAIAGANEVLTYSFVHGNLIDKAGQDKSHAFELTNALSPDLQFYRLSLVPSLLSKVHMNIKAGYDELALFEIGKAHIVGETDQEGLPREDDITALVVAAADKLDPAGAPYYLAKRYLEVLVKAPLNYRPIPEAFKAFDIVKPYQLDRSAAVYAGDKFLGLIGEFRYEVRQGLKLPKYTAGFELDTAALDGLVGVTAYQPLPKFPGTSRDLTLRVDEKVSYAQVAEFVEKVLDSSRLMTKLELTGIYQAEGEAVKNLTFRLHLTDTEKTITADEANTLVDQIAGQAKSDIQAETV
ncbi:MAG TPA: hypothetical protein VFL81_00215, partial [Candidatus Saccharimonadales bacterium]|nr:hypothetical protein [Candidatus Saccharimonadales bacterium]